MLRQVLTVVMVACGVMHAASVARADNEAAWVVREVRNVKHRDRDGERARGGWRTLAEYTVSGIGPYAKSESTGRYGDASIITASPTASKLYEYWVVGYDAACDHAGVTFDGSIEAFGKVQVPFIAGAKASVAAAIAYHETATGAVVEAQGGVSRHQDGVLYREYSQSGGGDTGFSGRKGPSASLYVGQLGSWGSITPTSDPTGLVRLSAQDGGAAEIDAGALELASRLHEISTAVPDSDMGVGNARAHFAGVRPQGDSEVRTFPRFHGGCRAELLLTCNDNEPVWITVTYRAKYSD